MAANLDPGTPQGQKIFDAKTRGLPEDKKFEITTAEGAALRRYFLGKQATLGGIVTNIPIEYNADGTVKSTANLIKLTLSGASNRSDNHPTTAVSDIPRGTLRSRRNRCLSKHFCDRVLFDYVSFIRLP